MQEQRAGERGQRRRKAPGGRPARVPSGRSSRAPRRPRRGAAASASPQRERRARAAARSPRSAAARSARARGAAARSRSAPCRAARSSAIVSSTAGCAARGLRRSRRASRCRARAPRSRTAARALARDRVEAAQQQLALGGVDDAEGQLDLGLGGSAARPSRHSPAARLLSLPCASTSSTPRPTRRPTTTRCAARWRRPGAEVELFTSRFAYGPVAPAPRLRAARVLLPRRRRARRRARAPGAASSPSTCPTCSRYRARGARGRRRALPVADRAARSTAACCPRGRPLVLTAHDILPREPRPGSARRSGGCTTRFDAVVVHSEHGRARLTGELGVDAERVHVIPHGALRAPRARRAGSAPPPCSQTRARRSCCSSG